MGSTTPANQRQNAAVRKARIKYALNSGGNIPTSGGVTRPGARGPWSESEDNPLSPNFLPPEERGEMGRARFWASYEQHRKSVVKAGQFDPVPGEK